MGLNHPSIPPSNPCRNHKISIVTLNITYPIYVGVIKTCICKLHKKNMP